MNKERNALKAGLFIVVSIAAAIITIMLIRGGQPGVMQHRTVAFALTDDISGLAVGDDVRIGGAKVGSVREIQFDGLDSASARILVRFSMPARYVIHEDAQVGIQTSLTGSPDLNITSLGTAKPLEDSGILKGLPDAKSALLAALRRASPHVEQIATSLSQQTLPKLNETIDSAKTFVRHVDGKIDPAIAKYDGVAEKTGQMMAEVRDLVGDVKSDFRGTVKNLNVATASVRDKLPPLMEKITTIVDKVDGAVNSARAALQDVEKTAANARDITGSARGIVVDNRTRIDNMIKSLKSTSDNLKTTSIEVRHSPWRLLYKPSADEMANLNLYDSARQFADGAGNLSDAAGALRDAMHDPNVDKAQVQKLMVQLDESFKTFSAAEEKLKSSVKQ